MSWDLIQENWKQLRGRVLAQWDKLTEDDLDQIGGEGDKLSDYVRTRYGIPKSEADKQVSEWIREPGVLDDWNDRRSI